MVEAKHLMKKDIGMLGKGKSDPYAVLNIGAQEFRTKTIDNSVDPKWDYWCEVCIVYIIYLSYLLSEFYACATLHVLIILIFKTLNFKDRQGNCT